jgi:hypothetical protein
MRRRRSISRRSRLIVLGLLALLVVGGGGTAVALKIKHDNEVDAERAREQTRLAEAARERNERADAARRREEADRREKAAPRPDRARQPHPARAEPPPVDHERRQGKVADGLLLGPVLKTVCDPVGGGRDDLSSRTGKYECLAVTDVKDDGNSSGYSYTGTINYQESSWSWGLGRG